MEVFGLVAATVAIEGPSLGSSPPAVFLILVNVNTCAPAFNEPFFQISGRSEEVFVQMVFTINSENYTSVIILTEKGNHPASQNINFSLYRYAVRDASSCTNVNVY